MTGRLYKDVSPATINYVAMQFCLYLVLIEFCCFYWMKFQHIYVFLLMCCLLGVLFSNYLPLIGENSLQVTNGAEGRRRHAAYSKCLLLSAVKSYFHVYNEVMNISHISLYFYCCQNNYPIHLLKLLQITLAEFSTNFGVSVTLLRMATPAITTLCLRRLPYPT